MTASEYPQEYDPLQAFIALFKDVQGAGAVARDETPKTLEERLRHHIIDGVKEGLAEALDAALEQYAPLDIINDHLLDGMKTVGELFGSGQMQLPFVLQSAEVMKTAVAYLEPRMERKAGQTKGSIVLATVKGDVHDIGKNLVDIILSNNGYTVHNIGIKQTLPQILEAWKSTAAQAIGLSGLLVKSVNVMEENLREMNEQGIDIPVILGGAALTRHYAEGHLRSTYKGKLYYGRDAFEGLRTMDHLVGGRLAAIDEEIAERLGKRSRAEEVIARSRAEQGRNAEAFEQAKSEGAAARATLPDGFQRPVDQDVPTPPFWGSRIVEAIDLDKVYPFINEVALFRGQWQFKKGAMSDVDYERALDETVRPVFERLKADCKTRGTLQPKVAYGYWPCQAQGDDLIVYDAKDHAREIERFRFPRQRGKQHRCISDFFRTVESGVSDVLGLTAVTVGDRASEEAQKLFQANNYTEYLYLHGFGVETAEALAEMWHKRIRAELGFAGDDAPNVRELFRQNYRGSRYSPGYPACPDMSDHAIIWRLLQPERIGAVLTENWQIVPEQSTCAFVVHHPDAKYFNV